MELQKEDLEKLYADTFKGLDEGTVVKGRVLEVKQDGVIIDVGYKREGFIPRSELLEREQDNLKPEDKIDVYVVELTDADGFIKLSRQKAEGIRTWEILEDAFHKGLIVEGKIIGKIKGGMVVSIGGVKAFLPGSQIGLKVLKETDHLIGETHTFKVIKLTNKTSNVIVSRRILLEEERNKLRKETLLKLKEGAVVKGTVKNLTDYGVFIDLGGIDGLLHISDMSWGRISHPGELFSIGDTVEVVILSFDSESEKVTLGYKQKKTDPWASVEEKYPPGKKVIGKVIGITDYGIFIELEEGVEGLVHVSEIDWLENVRKPSKYFSIGDTVEAAILKVNKVDKKISLSIKQLKPNPWEIIKEKYTVGQKITGTVKSFSDFGAFISLEDGIDALLHISDISWIKRIKHPSDALKKGEPLEVLILNIEPEKKRISVGLKELTTDPWIEEIPNKYNLGDTIKGKIVNTADFGLFVELEDGVEGLIHASELEKKIDEKIDELFKLGTELTARIINIDTDERKIGLSLKNVGDFHK